MTIVCTQSDQEKSALMRENTIVLPEYRPNIGAPFEVVLRKAVEQTVCANSGEIVRTRIPNMSGLLKEVAVARAIYPRKLSADEIKFLRKAVNLKATELAKLLGISAEHLSRCENRDRVLSPAAEKLFRVIVLKRRFNFSEMEQRLRQYIDKAHPDEKTVRYLMETMATYRECLDDMEKAVFHCSITTVHDAKETLSFSFHLRSLDLATANADHSQEDDEWKRAA